MLKEISQWFIVWKFVVKNINLKLNKLIKEKRWNGFLSDETNV